MSTHAEALVLLALLAATAPSPAAAQPIPEIEQAVAAISQARATAVVDQLVSYGTRYSGTPGCDASAAWIAGELGAAGLDVRTEPFLWGTTPMQNVQARHVGLVRPDEVLLVLAHYDSTSTTPFSSAPGADDDASGVAAVLEAARVLAAMKFESSIEFLLTSGEEQGLLGSEHHAAQAVLAGESFAGVVNHDMIAWWPTGWARDLDVCGDPTSAALVEAYRRSAQDYVPGVPVDARQDWGVCGDDQVSYAVRGMPALIVMDCYEAHLGQEGESTPHYHRTSDTRATLDFARMTEVIRATTATLAVLAVPITRTLYWNDELTEPAHAGSVLRPGSPAGGDETRIDPADPETNARHNPASPAVFSGIGEPQGPGARGALAFYETDRDETILLGRVDADADGALDLVVTFGG